MVDITERVCAEFNSTAKILKYLERCNQGVRICLRHPSGQRRTGVKEPTSASSTDVPVQDRKLTAHNGEPVRDTRANQGCSAVVGNSSSCNQQETEVREHSMNRCHTTVDEYVLTRDTQVTGIWNLSDTLALKQYLNEVYHLENLHVSRSADLRIGPAGNHSKQAPIGVELSSSWSTNQQVCQRVLLVISKFNLFDPGMAKQLRLISVLAARDLKLTNFSIVSRNQNGYWIIS